MHGLRLRPDLRICIVTLTHQADSTHLLHHRLTHLRHHTPEDDQRIELSWQPAESIPLICEGKLRHVDNIVSRGLVLNDTTVSTWSLHLYTACR